MNSIARKLIGLVPLIAVIASIFGARVTAAEAASKWARRLGGAGEDIRRGINAVTEAPGVAAAKQKAKMRAKVLAAIDDGTWERNVSAVSLADWKSAAIDKGVDRIASGAQAAEGKMTRFMNELLPAVDAAVALVDRMPNVTLDDSINRMTTYVREMAKFRKTPGR